MEGNYLSPIIDAFKPMLIFAAVLWGIEIIITMLIKDHKKAKRKQDGVKLHVDHIVPVSRGGKSVMGNLQTLCEDCNCGKGNRYEE